MDKIAELKTIAKSIGVGGILGTGAGVAATEQIHRNRNNARAKKGWATRRRMQKSASDSRDTLPEVRSAVRTLGLSLDNPTKAAKIFAVKALITKVRNLFKPHKVNHYGN